MRIAIFSDIHGNKEALSAIIDDIKKDNIDETICLGDSIGIGPNPSECLDLLIKNNIKTLLGNHELYFLKGTDIDDEMGESQVKHQNWIKEKIREDQKKYLENSKLTMGKEFNGKKVLFEHFLIDNNTKEDYPFYDLNIVNDGSINNIVESLDYDLIFIGHEHRAFNIEPKLYDVGSSGCRNDNITRYTILDTDTFNIETKNITFDRESFIKALLKYDYPDRNLIAKWFYGMEIKWR